MLLVGEYGERVTRAAGGAGSAVEMDGAKKVEKKRSKKALQLPLRRSPRFLDEQGKSMEGESGSPKKGGGKNKAHKPRRNLDSVQITLVHDFYQPARESKDLVRKGTGLVYDERMTEHLCLWDPNYPECPERFTVTLERCRALGLVERCFPIPSREAREEEISTLHSEDLVSILKSTAGCSEQSFLEVISEQYDGIYIHPSTYKLSMLAAGSTIDLVDSIVEGKVQNGMAVIRPPGHHAMKNDFCGYCFFNNVALATRHALEKWKMSRVLIVDWDVHHGQASQQMFYEDSRVVYFSIHRYEHGKFWPHLRESDFDFVGQGPGKGYNFNVPLNKTGMNNADYMAIFHQILLPMAYEFQPELIIVSAGYDAALGCPEFNPELVIVSAGFDSSLGDEKGEMEVTPAFYAHLLSTLLALASGRIAVVLEGGYCLKSLAEGAALCLRTLLGDPCPLVDALGEPSDSIRDTILNVIYAHSPFWKCFQFQGRYSMENTDILKGTHHKPEVKFLSTFNKPEKYPIKDDYPIQSPEAKKQFDERLNVLIKNTNLSFPKHRVALVYDERMLKHKNLADPSHPERPSRITSIFQFHQDYGLVDRCLKLESRDATDEELRLLHTENYITLLRMTSKMKFRELSKIQDDLRSVYFHPDTFSSAILAAGCTLTVVDSVLNSESRSGIAIVRPPGHHAEEEESCGFCFFNNVALAAKYAIEMHGMKRVLIVDWDVHHGNGTQHMFESDPKVLYVSIHRYEHGAFFPGTKDANYSVVGNGKGEGYNVNIPWNQAGMGDAEYMAAFHQVILPIAYQFNPELVLISAGFDAAKGDPLGGCKVSPEAYGHFTHLLTSLANGRVIVVLEGGYNLLSISYAMCLCTKALLGDPLPKLIHETELHPSAVESIKNTIRVHKKYWSALKFQVDLPEENVFESEGGEKVGEETRKDQEKEKETKESVVALEEAMNALSVSSQDAIRKLPEVGRVVETEGAAEVETVVNNAAMPEAKNIVKEKSSGPDLEELGACGGTSDMVTFELMNYLEDLDGIGYPVFPQTWCPHLDSVHPWTQEILDTNLPCEDCQVVGENWICLTCSRIYCSRYVNQHMVQHAMSTGHPLAMSFADLSVWCYGCDTYVDNKVLYAIKNAAHKHKFGEIMPWSYESNPNG